MMKNAAVLILSFLSFSAMAADVTTNVSVVKDGQVVYEQTNRFVGMTDAEAAKLNKSAMQALDFASNQQHKGGSYTIVWSWSGMPAVETEGMTFQGVNATLRKSHAWLDGILKDSEKAAGQKKGKPWGNQ